MTQTPLETKNVPDTIIKQLGYWTTLAEENTFLDNLNAANARMEIDTIGTSASGRPLRAVRIGRNSPPDQKRGKRPFLVEGCPHGDELAGREAALAFIRDMVEATDPALLSFLDAHDVYVFPTNNPDGANLFLTSGNLDGRYNGNGVDLNRDALVMTQPESRALASLIRDVRPEVTIHLHEADSSPTQEMSLAAADEMPMVDSQLATLSADMITYLRAQGTAEGITSQMYAGNTTTTVPNPNVARMLRSLTHGVGMLYESKNKDNQPLNRRVFIHRRFTRFALDFHAANSDRIRTTQNSAIRRAESSVLARTTFRFGDDTVLNPLPTGYSLTPTQEATVRPQLDALGALVENGIVWRHQAAGLALTYLLDPGSTFNALSASRIFDAPYTHRAESWDGYIWREMTTTQSDGQEMSITAFKTNAVSSQTVSLTTSGIGTTSASATREPISRTVTAGTSAAGSTSVSIASRTASRTAAMTTTSQSSNSIVATESDITRTVSVNTLSSGTSTVTATQSVERTVGITTAAAGSTSITSSQAVNRAVAVPTGSMSTNTVTDVQIVSRTAAASTTSSGTNSVTASTSGGQSVNVSTGSTTTTSATVASRVGGSRAVAATSQSNSVLSVQAVQSATQAAPAATGSIGTTEVDVASQGGTRTATVTTGSQGATAALPGALGAFDRRWGFTGDTTLPTEEYGASDVTVSPFVGSNVTATFDNDSVDDRRYELCPRILSTTAAAAIANDVYVEFTLSAPRSFFLSRFTFEGARGNTSSPRGMVVRSSLDGYATDLPGGGNFLTVDPTYATRTIDVSSIIDVASVTFRMYPYTPSTSNVVVYLDDMRIEGMVETAGQSAIQTVSVVTESQSSNSITTSTAGTTSVNLSTLSDSTTTATVASRTASRTASVSTGSAGLTTITAVQTLSRTAVMSTSVQGSNSVVAKQTQYGSVATGSNNITSVTLTQKTTRTQAVSTTTTNTMSAMRPGASDARFRVRLNGAWVAAKVRINGVWSTSGIKVRP